MPRTAAIHKKAQEIADERGRSLLVMYWPDDGLISTENIKALRTFLKKKGLSRKTKEPNLVLQLQM